MQECPSFGPEAHQMWWGGQLIRHPPAARERGVRDRHPEWRQTMATRPAEGARRGGLGFREEQAGEIWQPAVAQRWQNDKRLLTLPSVAGWARTVPNALHPRARSMGRSSTFFTLRVPWVVASSSWCPSALNTAFM